MRGERKIGLIDQNSETLSNKQLGNGSAISAERPAKHIDTEAYALAFQNYHRLLLSACYRKLIAANFRPAIAGAIREDIVSNVFVQLLSMENQPDLNESKGNIAKYLLGALDYQILNYKDRLYAKKKGG